MNIWRFITVLLLRNKDQEYNNPLASFATCLCWQRIGLPSRGPRGHDFALMGLAFIYPALPTCMGVGRGGLAPPGFWNYWQKRLFFQFRGVNTKFHHFWPHPGKNFGKIPYCPPPLEKILPTPMPTCLVVYVQKSDFHLINVFCVVIVVKKRKLPSVSNPGFPEPETRIFWLFSTTRNPGFFNHQTRI